MDELLTDDGIDGIEEIADLESATRDWETTTERYTVARFITLRSPVPGGERYYDIHVVCWDEALDSGYAYVRADEHVDGATPHEVPAFTVDLDDLTWLLGCRPGLTHEDYARAAVVVAERRRASLLPRSPTLLADQLQDVHRRCTEAARETQDLDYAERFARMAAALRQKAGVSLLHLDEPAMRTLLASAERLLAEPSQRMWSMVETLELEAAE